MFRAITLLALTFIVNSFQSTNDQRMMEVISSLLSDSKCPGTIVVIDPERTDQQLVDDGLASSFTKKHFKPVTLLELSDFNQESNSKKEHVCQDIVLFSSASTRIAATYRQMKHIFFVNTTVIIGRFSPEESRQLLLEIQNENVFIVLEKTSLDLEIYTWKTNNRTIITTLFGTVEFRKKDIEHLFVPNNLLGRHLKIATLPYSPSIIIDDFGDINGIEPSILDSIANRLQFTYEYIQASPSEMWGEIFINDDGSVKFTGLIGMLAKKEVDVALGQLYISSVRMPYIGYTTAYKFTYESFLVPAPEPYAKWTAVLYSFSLQIWMATIISFIVVVFMLRLVASCSSEGRSTKLKVFQDLQFCCLYAIGNLSNVQMHPQIIISNANRMLLICWLFATLIITTGYRSGLISYMTFPFTPPPVDTLQELVDSSLKKLIFGGFLKSILVNSSAYKLEMKLGNELIINYNLTEMYLSLVSGSTAVASNVDNLLYTAATLYPPTANGPRVHLIKDSILPVQAAFGLQKGSQLKPYFDREIIRLIEAGIVDYHSNSFAKKIDKWNPKKEKCRITFSLNSLQGAFYLLGIGLLGSLLSFFAEVIYFKLFNGPPVLNQSSCQSTNSVRHEWSESGTNGFSHSKNPQHGIHCIPRSQSKITLPNESLPCRITALTAGRDEHQQIPSLRLEVEEVAPALPLTLSSL